MNDCTCDDAMEAKCDEEEDEDSDKGLDGRLDDELLLDEDEEEATWRVHSN